MEGVLSSAESDLVCCLIEFYHASSQIDAEIIALRESLQFLLREVVYDEVSLEIRSNSKIIEAWCNNDHQLL